MYSQRNFNNSAWVQQDTRANYSAVPNMRSQPLPQQRQEHMYASNYNYNGAGGNSDQQRLQFGGYNNNVGNNYGHPNRNVDNNNSYYVQGQQHQQNNQLGVIDNNYSDYSNNNNNAGLNDFFQRRNYDNANSGFGVVGAVASAANTNNTTQSRNTNLENNSIGTISTLTNEFGLINEEIVFEPVSCVCFVPKVGDRVVYESVYSPAGRFKWAATRVALFNANNTQPLFERTQHAVDDEPFTRRRVPNQQDRRRSPSPLPFGRRSSPIAVRENRKRAIESPEPANWREIAARKRLAEEMLLAERSSTQQEQQQQPIFGQHSNPEPPIFTRPIRQISVPSLMSRNYKPPVQRQRALTTVKRSVIAPPPPKLSKPNKAPPPPRVPAITSTAALPFKKPTFAPAVAARPPARPAAAPPSSNILQPVETYDLVIYDSNAPGGKFNKNQQNVVLRAIEVAMTSYLLSCQNQVTVKVANSHFEDGKLLLRITQGQRALRRILAKMAVPYVGAMLTIRKQQQVFVDEPNRRHKIFFLLKSNVIKMRSAKEVLKVIGKQNNDLNVLKWRVLEREEKDTGMSGFHVDIDDGSFNTLRRMNWRINFLLSEVFVRHDKYLIPKAVLDVAKQVNKQSSENENKTSESAKSTETPAKPAATSEAIDEVVEVVEKNADKDQVFVVDSDDEADAVEIVENAHPVIDDSDVIMAEVESATETAVDTEVEAAADVQDVEEVADDAVENDVEDAAADEAVEEFVEAAENETTEVVTIKSELDA